MSISIQTNINALTAQDNLRVTNDFQSKTIQRLTSGYRINSSGDDAAGLAVANKFRSDTAELTQGVRNANDGISTLQILDGGLNNISKMLDRMKTLATQSASGTFTGNRDTLNTEYQSLTAEITRQANNVQLNGGGTYNALIGVYIGGATASANGNASVSIDLSGLSNAVDANALLVAGTSIAGGANVVSGGTKDLRGQTALLAGGGTQTFSVNYVNQSNVAANASVVLTGTTAGLTTDQALSQLNSQLTPYGITASTTSLGVLQFSGSGAFSINTTASTADSLTTNTIATTVDNNSLYHLNSDGPNAITLSSAGESIQIGSGSNTVTVSMGADTTALGKANLINSFTAAIGVKAVVNSAGKIALTGTAAFSVVKLTVATTASNDTFALTAGSKIVTGPTAGTSATGNALSALSLIASAVQAVGKVQGAIGASQNKLQYAINLAQSQISGFSAAESRIRDTDVAAEAANLTKAQVLVQASMAAMAQANSAPQAVMALLR